MLRVGLTGGLASGKSHVGKLLEDMGCLLIKADDLGHETLRPSGEAHAAAVKEFGPAILNADGSIDRKKLGAIVFADRAKLDRLNAIVHPAVRRLSDRLMGEYAAFHPRGIAVYEAAILIETGGHKNFDRLILAACGEEQQVERAMKRDGASRESVLARLAQQMPLRDKVAFADHVIDTSGSLQHTLEQTRAVYELLRSEHEG